MKRSKIVRLQLALLALVVCLMLVRAFTGSGRPDGVVVFSDIDLNELQHASFVVEGALPVVVEATGSYERSGEMHAGPRSLAAYGWIIRRDNREVVWKLDGQNAQPVRGLVAHASDTLALDAGIYDVFFTSFGNSFYGGRNGNFFGRMFDPELHWQNDRKKWFLAVRSPEGKGDIRRLDDSEVTPRPEGLIWTSAPMRDNQSASHLFEVKRSAALRLYGLGEMNGSPKDYGYIEEAVSGEKVWEMKREATQAAGGALENRLADSTLYLQPGIYRAVFETDRTHAYEDWRANPPWNPTGWGLTLAALAPEDSTAIVSFDPWQTRKAIAAMTSVGNDQLVSTRFRVTRPLKVLVYAVGEIIGANAYDYGWIEKDDTHEHVWDMEPEATLPAGGDKKNRLLESFLTLDPGTYTAYYQTDESHAFGDWNSERPDHPDRWGLVVFPVSETLDPDAVVALDHTSRNTGQPERSRHEPPPSVIMGNILIRANRLTNESRVEAPLNLSKPTDLRIYAVGEIDPRGQYDFGWIEKAGAGERVWEMSWENTQPAGGDDRNRRFYGDLSLPEGQYTVRFQTDLSHGYGDFGANTPEDPDAWGITISKAP